MEVPAQIYVSDHPIKRIEIYVNSKKKTAAQIYDELRPDVIINGGLFDGNFRPVMNLKADGHYWAFENGDYLGYGWNDDGKVHYTSAHSSFKNFIACIPLHRNKSLSYPVAMAGARGRTAIGFDKTGKYIIMCGKDGSSLNKTPEQLKDMYFNLYGVEHAIMLDGGGSSQGVFPDTKVVASRIVQNFILIWEDK